jgi:hypothetical protein
LHWQYAFQASCLHWLQGRTAVKAESPEMTLEAFILFALGFFVGSFTVLGLLIIASLRGKRRRSRRSSHRRAAADTA